MMVNSTVNWRIVDVEVAATMAAETMAMSGTGDVAADITKLRRDVLKQALASLAAFIGSVNYSESFHMSAAAQGNANKKSVVVGEAVDSSAQGEPSLRRQSTRQAAQPAEPKTQSKGFCDNPLYDLSKI